MAEVIRLSRFQSDLSRALSRRGRQLLEASDLPKQVAALAPLEAYFIVKELGVDDASPLLQHCTPDQVQAFVDLDCWDGDLPDANDLDAWLAPFAALGPEALARVFTSLDSEIQVLFLRANLEVWINREEEEQPPHAPASVQQKQTVDSFFIIRAIPKAEREVEPFVLIDALYRHDLQDAFALLTAVRWELTAPLEEEAYRFRNGRLEELGFPARAEAIHIFSPPTNTKPVPTLPVDANAGAHLPALYAEALDERSLLNSGLSRVTQAAVLDRVEASLMALVNNAVIAFGHSPRSVSNVRDVARQVRDTVSLGIETVLSPDGPLPFPEGEDAAAAGAHLLADRTVVDLFRHGHRECRRLAEVARALVSDPVIARWFEVSPAEEQDYGEDRLDREFVRGLFETPPVYRGLTPVGPDRARAFATRRDLDEAGERLNRIRDRVG